MIDETLTELDLWHLARALADVSGLSDSELSRYVNYARLCTAWTEAFKIRSAAHKRVSEAAGEGKWERELAWRELEQATVKEQSARMAKDAAIPLALKSARRRQ